MSGIFHQENYVIIILFDKWLLSYYEIHLTHFKEIKTNEGYLIEAHPKKHKTQSGVLFYVNWMLCFQNNFSALINIIDNHLNLCKLYNKVIISHICTEVL